LAKAELECSTELAAYMPTITTAAQDYEHPAWERYNQVYWDKAVATGNKKWSQVDTALFNQMFTRRARCFTPNNPKQDTFTRSSPKPVNGKTQTPCLHPVQGSPQSRYVQMRIPSVVCSTRAIAHSSTASFTMFARLEVAGGTTSPEATHLHTEVVS